MADYTAWGAMDEAALREAEPPRCESAEALGKFIDALVTREHDYGTCVYAMSLAAVAAFNYVARELGVTGFQASCADMDILKRTRRMEHGFRILDYANLLYPQYRETFDDCGFDAMLAANAERLATEAAKLLVENPNAHPDVLAHWTYLVSSVSDNG